MLQAYWGMNNAHSLYHDDIDMQDEERDVIFTYQQVNHTRSVVIQPNCLQSCKLMQLIQARAMPAMMREWLTATIHKLSTNDCTHSS